MWELQSEERIELKKKKRKKKVAKCEALAHVHSAHAAFQLLEHRMHPHNPPTLWAVPVFFACVLLHVSRGVIFDLT